MDYTDIIKKLTLDEKIALLSGDGMWHTKSIERLNIRSVMMTDGPHGLRKIADEGKDNLYDSVNSTCFPTASLSACSWDEGLIEEMGNAIAEEAMQEGVSVVLGPGANIKRSPLCGRNFEYFSEDPLLAGKMAAAWIRGVERRGICASLKHFAVNNQEHMRLSISAEVDERALREIYLKPFEIAVKQGAPSTVMCAYNRINGEYCSNNKRLLTDILRGEWGFDGLVVSDWGAVDDRVLGIKAGMDLEMPDSKGYYDGSVKTAIENGSLSMSELDACVNRVLAIVKNGRENLVSGYRYDLDEHASLAEKVALESAVLLKNDGALPLKKSEKVLVIGSLAKETRYQGGGSSHITPHKVISLIDGLAAIGCSTDYIDGYSIHVDKNAKKLLNSAVSAASGYDKIVLCVGLIDEYETEGMDRAHLDLPQNQNDLIAAISMLGKQFVIVYYGGSPARIYDDKAAATLCMYLAGEKCGMATAKLLCGINNPCGKLAETFPLTVNDTPCFGDYGKNLMSAVYSESIYVGYRFYDSAKIDVKYPFGHGLSYARFEYSDLKVGGDNYTLTDSIGILFNIKNNSHLDGKEIAQVYIRKISGNVYAPFQELKGFKKVSLSAHETQSVDISVSVSDLAIYYTPSGEWKVESGEYEIAVGTSSLGVKLTARINVVADALEPIIVNSWYNAPILGVQPEFDKLRGYVVSHNFVPPKKGNFTIDNSLIELADGSFMVRRIIAIAGFFLRHALKVPKTDTGYIMTYEMFKTSPLKKLTSSSQGAFNQSMCEGLVLILNGKMIKGLRKLLKGNKTRQPLNI